MEGGSLCESYLSVDFDIIVEPCYEYIDEINTPEELECCLFEPIYTRDPNNTLTTTDTRPAYIATSGDWYVDDNAFIDDGFAIAGDPINLDVDLVVPAGVTLTIHNMDINFTPDRRVLVQAGGTLIVNGGTYSSFCNTMWQGFQVQGNGLSPGLSNGVLHIKNEATIEHAIFGVITTASPLLDVNTLNTQVATVNLQNVTISSVIFLNFWLANLQTLLLNSGGCVEIASDMGSADFSCTFSNCLIGVYAVGHTGNPLCTQYIHEAVFTSTNNLRYPFEFTTTEAGVHAMTTEQVRVHNCEFNNLRYGMRLVETLGQIELNQVTNCQVGLSTRDLFAGLEQDLNAEANDFYGCQIAIQADAGSYCGIRNNTVNLSTDLNPYTDPYGVGNSIGFYLRGSNGQIANNDIHNVSIGMVLTDNFEDGLIIAGNQISNTSSTNNGILREAIISEGNNLGVELSCNHLLGYRVAGFDMRQWSDTGDPTDLADQGNCIGGQSAANTFLGANDGDVLCSSWVADIFRDNTAINDFKYEDVGATSLSVVDNSNPTFNVDLQPCAVPGEGLDSYCDDLGYTPLANIDLISDEVLKNKELSKHLYALLAAEDHTAALLLIYDYNSQMTERRQISHQIATGQTADAQTKLNNYPSDNEEDQRYKEYQQLVLDLKMENKEYYEINATQEELLYDIATSKTRMAYPCQTWLYAAKGIEFPVPMPTLLDGSGGFNSAFKRSDELKISTIKPNPTNGQFALDFVLAENEIGELNIYTSTGVLIDSNTFMNSGTLQLDSRSYSSGLYLCVVKVNDKVIYQDKLIVVQ